MLGILSESIVKGDELLREYVLRMSREYPRSTIVLFGSRARGDYLPYSDYDIAVIMEKVQDERDLVTRIRRLKPEGLPLDLLLITVDDLNDSVIKDMLRGCVILYDGLEISNRLESLGCEVRA